jgi:prepilin-type N-terminal cleavage/methylation domain-containing protein
VSVKMREIRIITGRGENRERGFSMIELMVVITLILVISAFAIIQLPTNLSSMRADTALRQVVDQLRQAREYSIANRRFVQVTFLAVGGTSQILMVQRNDLTPGGGPVNPVLGGVPVPIQAPMQFLVFGAKPDTPDAFGNGAAIFFGGVNGGPPAGMFFRSDGEFINAANNLPINGTVFLGVPGDPSTGRAVTLLGTTGRVRGWRGSGTAWTQF